MIARRVWLGIITFLMIFPKIGFSTPHPTDTIALWKGEKVHYGSEVTLYAFKPDNPNGISIIVCPGGSYHWHDRNDEGLKVGEWLSDNGITAFVLFYRVAGCAEVAIPIRLLFRGKRHPDMITDAQRALQYVGEHSVQYGLDPDKIGMMGFSAGGHLAMSAACFSSTNYLELSGINSDANLKPAFVAAIYPVITMHAPYAHRRSRRGLLGNNRENSRRMRDSLSLEDHIPDNCPPVFLINCLDDPVVPYQNSVLLDSALTQRNIPHRYNQYKRGKHGFGVSDYYGSPECREWKDDFLSWLRELYSSSL